MTWWASFVGVVVVRGDWRRRVVVGRGMLILGGETRGEGLRWGRRMEKLFVGGETRR